MKSAHGLGVLPAAAFDDYHLHSNFPLPVADEQHMLVTAYKYVRQKMVNLLLRLRKAGTRHHPVLGLHVIWSLIQPLQVHPSWDLPGRWSPINHFAQRFGSEVAI